MYFQHMTVYRINLHLLAKHHPSPNEIVILLEYKNCGNFIGLIMKLPLKLHMKGYYKKNVITLKAINIKVQGDINMIVVLLIIFHLKHFNQMILYFIKLLILNQIMY